jgi:glycosidase
MLLLSALSACCRNSEPLLVAQPDEPYVLATDEVLEIPLADLLLSEVTEDELSVDLDVDRELAAAVTGDTLRVVPEAGWSGEASLTVAFEDACGESASVDIEVLVGEQYATVGDCSTRFAVPDRGAEAVYLAGEFNGWDYTQTPLERDGAFWTTSLDLAGGSWAYKVVELHGGEAQWSCDPSADFYQCDRGYSWNPECEGGWDSCNSLVRVPDCEQPRLILDALDIDRDAGSVRLETSFISALDGSELGSALVSLDGQTVSTELGDLEVGTLSPGRHTLRVYATDLAGREAEELYIPFWTDGRDWDSGLMYYVFVDRFEDGDVALNSSEGASHALTDYLGGDWQGVIDRLDYLEELGVTVIWLTAPQDNGEGAWGDSCDEDYSGYHGYWPSDAYGMEEHFGTEEELRLLIDEAHARNMRVLTDWVANHVHQDHPYYQDHPEWFTAELVCEGTVWETDPETCWFDTFLPDIKYYDKEPLELMVDDAVWWVKEYELDGYRVDAVKHMPHSVFANFQARVKNEIEHSEVGGDEDFYTVGETFSGDRGLIGSYVNERELDAQFDFTLYWSILSAIGRRESSLLDLEQTFEDSEAAYEGYLMSTFLGNHDVERFIAHASYETSSLYGDGACPEGWIRGPDTAPDWDEPYQRLMLAWTWLLGHEGLPLIYYGDEVGLPGYHDPDNRQMMRFDDELSWREAEVLEHVRSLGQARLDHPAMSSGERVRWWEEDEVLAWARVNGDDEVLIAINRSDYHRTLDNGLSWAGLSEGTWTDVLTGERFTSSDDRIAFDVAAMGSRVLVRE